MAKGYWIGRIKINNDAGYQTYAAANPAIFNKFGFVSAFRVTPAATGQVPSARRAHRVAAG